jgi:uncharacterized damage-inducible protein DinB
MITPNTKRYLIAALAGAPTVLTALLKDASAEDYDKKVDPDRFTLREMLAHLADWEAIFLGRLQQLKNEEHPVLIGIDEAQWSIDHDHAHSDYVASLETYRTGRSLMVDFIKDLSSEDLLRTGHHTEAGDMNVVELLALISAHDNYHFLQTAQWLA